MGQRLTPTQTSLLKGLPSSVITKGMRLVGDQLVAMKLARWDPEYDGFLEPTRAGSERAFEK